MQTALSFLDKAFFVYDTLICFRKTNMWIVVSSQKFKLRQVESQHCYFTQRLGYLIIPELHMGKLLYFD